MTAPDSRIDKDYILEMNKGIRVDCLDKLDQISYHQKLRNNFVKWWAVNITEPEKIGSDEEIYDPDAAAEELLNEALGGMEVGEGELFGDIPAPHGEAAGEAKEVAEPEIDMSDPATAEAMEIFRRLEAEAAADEAAKQAEIEAAKIAAGLGNSQDSVSQLVSSAKQN